ncbi:hypothetical protein CTKA_02287 [Chthonomonas calidirosea]|uniref:Uncharacterized protein n=1 Tax=Chthonomonas calidirosea (strain DSM 23976 / ICMP 18418 / T49) TaxID=1303518 RepID=S0EYR1_CHTCT|nr:hypothetical protein CCALI_01807 [Chthonomonas calidirosea T49]CEK18736.1 hypothetical protein CP488_02285 [Chthonomonas calidirosea]CEK19731.1 hypothetical protein CTKA_02287 [Chthonomonas calidirosea]
MKPPARWGRAVPTFSVWGSPCCGMQVALFPSFGLEGGLVERHSWKGGKSLQIPYRPAGLLLDVEGLDFSGPPIACPAYANRDLVLQPMCTGRKRRRPPHKPKPPHPHLHPPKKPAPPTLPIYHPTPIPNPFGGIGQFNFGFNQLPPCKHWSGCNSDMWRLCEESCESRARVEGATIGYAIGCIYCWPPDPYEGVYCACRLEEIW